MMSKEIKQKVAQEMPVEEERSSEDGWLSYVWPTKVKEASKMIGSDAASDVAPSAPKTVVSMATFSESTQSSGRPEGDRRPSDITSIQTRAEGMEVRGVEPDVISLSSNDSRSSKTESVETSNTPAHSSTDSSSNTSECSPYRPQVELAQGQMSATSNSNPESEAGSEKSGTSDTKPSSDEHDQKVFAEELQLLEDLRLTEKLQEKEDAEAAKAIQAEEKDAILASKIGRLEKKISKSNGYGSDPELEFDGSSGDSVSCTSEEDDMPSHRNVYSDYIYDVSDSSCCGKIFILLKWSIITVMLLWIGTEGHQAAHQYSQNGLYKAMIGYIHLVYVWTVIGFGMYFVTSSGKPDSVPVHDIEAPMEKKFDALNQAVMLP